MEQILDTIDREILIQAPVERVWGLVSEPGWFINGGSIREHTLRPDPDRESVTVVTDPEYGDFSLETVASAPPRSISFRWRGGAVDEGRAVVQTLVEFTLTPTPTDAGPGTLLRVVESGWAAGGTVDAGAVDGTAQEAAAEAAEAVASEYRENAEGWEIELQAAKTHLERV